jgi:AcrR family transcriptional regulator
MSEIAGEAGVTARAIYHYVNSKSVLFARTVEATYARFVDEVVEQVLAPPHESTRSRLRAYTDVIRSLYLEDPSLVAFLSVAVLETERHVELQGALPAAFHDDVPSFNKMLVAEAVARDELARGVEPAGAVTLLDVLGLGVTVVASKEQPEDYLAMLDVLDRLLEGSLFAATRAAPQDTAP